MVAKRWHNRRDKPTTGITSRPQRSKRKTYTTHRIFLKQEPEWVWYWVYEVNRIEKARSRGYTTLAGASQGARAFRKLIKDEDKCEIIPPPDHKYSGG